MLVIFAQSAYASRLFISFACVLGAWFISTTFLMSVSGKSEQGASAEASAIRGVWIFIWGSTIVVLLMASHMWYTAAYYEEFAVNPRPQSEVVALKMFALVLWIGGAAWLWVLLRVRHYVTLSVMLTLLTDRAFDDIGTSAIYWLSFIHALLAAALMFFMTYITRLFVSLFLSLYLTLFV